VPLRYELAADIAQLKDSLQLPDFEYVDICAQIGLQCALQRWPLLTALSEAQQHEEAVALLERQVKK
jgi:hypothetical protein